MKYQIPLHDMPEATGPYSIGTTAARQIYTSGIVAQGDDGELIEGSARAQTSRILDLMERILAGVDLELSDVAKVTVFVTSMRDLEAVDEVMSDRFSLPMPARTVACVSELPLGACVQMDAVACR